MKKNKIILVGKAASGKSFLKDYLVNNKGYTYYKPYTTRPKRKSDNDNEYVFVDDVEFDKLIELDMLADHKTFNTHWRYGFSKYAYFDPYDLIIISPNALDNIYNNNRQLLKDWCIVYLDTDSKTRHHRLLDRFKDDVDDSVTRRMQSDDEDFCNFDYFDVCITSTETNQIQLMLSLVKQFNK